MASLPLPVLADEPLSHERLTVRLVGNHQRIAELELAIDGQLYTTDVNGEISISSPTLDSTIRLISSEYTLYEEAVDLSREGATLWVQTNPLEATGLYQLNYGTTQTISLSRQDVETTPGSLNDPIRAVQTLAPVGQAPLDSAWLLVRGGRESDTSQSLDGVELPNLLHLGGYSAAIHPMFIESTTLTPSGLSAELGRAISGNLNLTTSPLMGDIATDAGIDIINGHLFLSTPAPGGAAAFSVRRSWLRSALENFSALGSEGSRIAPSFFDTNARWEGEGGSIHLIGLSDNIDLPTTDGEVITAQMGSGLVVGHWDDALAGEDWSVDIRGRAGSHQASLVAGETTKSQRVNGAALHAILSSDRESFGTVRAGLDSEAEQATVSLSPVSVVRSLLSIEPWAEATFGDETFLSTGLRYSNFVVEHQHLRGAISPRLQVGTRLGDIVFKAYLSRLHQSPDIVYLTSYPEGHSLDLETSNEAGSGVMWANRFLSISSNFYIRSIPVITMVESDGTLGQGEAITVGSETAAVLNYRNWRLDLTGVVMRSQQREERHDEWAHSYRYHPVELASLLRWNLGDGWTLSAQGGYSSGAQWDTKIPTATDMTNNEILDLVNIVDSDGWLPDYYSLDLKISRAHTFRDWSLSFYMDLQNVTNHRVPELILSGFESTNGYGVGMPFLPVIGVAGRILPKDD